MAAFFSCVSFVEARHVCEPSGMCVFVRFNLCLPRLPLINIIWLPAINYFACTSKKWHCSIYIKLFLVCISRLLISAAHRVSILLSHLVSCEISLCEGQKEGGKYAITAHILQITVPVHTKCLKSYAPDIAHQLWHEVIYYYVQIKFGDCNPLKLCDINDSIFCGFTQISFSGI
jgi:hypothetical protein